MKKEDTIANSKYSIFCYYFEKLLLLLCSAIFFKFSHLEYQASEWHWLVHGLIGLALLICADALALPIERVGNRFIFHHLWRTSSMDISEIRFLWLSGGGRFKMQQKRGQQIMLALGKYPWNFYHVECDKKNKLADIFYTHQTH